MSNATSTISIVRAVADLLGATVEAIKAVEAAIPQSGAGAAKLEAVRTILQTAYSVADAAAPAFDAIWPTLQAVASNIVTTFNKLGIFKTGAA